VLLCPTRLGESDVRNKGERVWMIVALPRRTRSFDWREAVWRCCHPSTMVPSSFMQQINASTSYFLATTTTSASRNLVLA
jgi:hypothetical protein